MLDVFNIALHFKPAEPWFAKSKGTRESFLFPAKKVSCLSKRSLYSQKERVVGGGSCIWQFGISAFLPDNVLYTNILYLSDYWFSKGPISISAKAKSYFQGKWQIKTKQCMSIIRALEQSCSVLKNIIKNCRRTGASEWHQWTHNTSIIKTTWSSKTFLDPCMHIFSCLVCEIAV